MISFVFHYMLDVICVPSLYIHCQRSIYEAYVYNSWWARIVWIMSRNLRAVSKVICWDFKFGNFPCPYVQTALPVMQRDPNVILLSSIKIKIKNTVLWDPSLDKFKLKCTNKLQTLYQKFLSAENWNSRNALFYVQECTDINGVLLVVATILYKDNWTV
jgi:hypothetical protein